MNKFNCLNSQFFWLKFLFIFLLDHVSVMEVQMNLYIPIELKFDWKYQLHLTKMLLFLLIINFALEAFH